MESLNLIGLANLAHRLGFFSEEINALRSQDIPRIVATGFVDALYTEEFFKPKLQDVQPLSSHFDSVLQKFSTFNDSPEGVCYFTTNDSAAKAERRFNTPTKHQYEEQRCHLFLKNVFVGQQDEALYPTALGVIRDTLVCFFGNLADHEAFHGKGQNSMAGPINTDHSVDSGADAMILENEDLDGNQYSASEYDDDIHSEPNQLDDTTEMVHKSLETAFDEPTEPSDPIDLEPHPSGTPDHEIVSEPCEPIDLEPHPRGTPDHELPLLPGFEDDYPVGPLNVKLPVPCRHQVISILRKWFTSTNHDLIVLFLFEDRTYYKFKPEGDYHLRSTLKQLSSKYNFFIYRGEFGFGVPDINNIFEEVLKWRLLLVGKIDNPKQRKDETGMRMSVETLKTYFSENDVHTGKRKRIPKEGGPDGQEIRKEDAKEDRQRKRNR
ncbi:uncharacterized protein N7484_007018 [Penicillium longicatenatum]|uniref:uncharacterized protein n=1 Tax=Penicillium longicatenatum TaxID=1561947 RepID=UPI002547AA55|nr:uncharacterized protein N7484_007018 [Penicillium longicatenatum]KAJ5639156.1 hypothetical protein N7484_007018 [Penicillium longicatenatum]